MLPADIVGTLIYHPQDGDVRDQARPDLRQPRAGRRDQPRAGQGAERAARGDAGAAGDARRARPTHCPSRSWCSPRRIPIEQEGTYPLPEAQVDRFMLKVVVDYPDAPEERAILDAMATTEPRLEVQPVVSAEEIMRARARGRPDLRRRQGARLHRRHRARHARPEGVRPRSWAAMCNTARRRAPRSSSRWPRKAAAFLQGRGYVTPQDVKARRAGRAAPPHQRDATRPRRRTSRPTTSCARILDTVAVP